MKIILKLNSYTIYVVAKKNFFNNFWCKCFQNLALVMTTSTYAWIDNITKITIIQKFKREILFFLIIQKQKKSSSSVKSSHKRQFRRKAEISSSESEEWVISHLFANQKYCYTFWDLMFSNGVTYYRILQKNCFLVHKKILLDIFL